jgi:hypothetical protein
MTTDPKSLEKRQMAEPRPAPEGADVGGMSSTADAGLGRATQRSTERAEADPLGPASTGNASGAAQSPRLDLGGKNEPGSAPGTTRPADRPAADDRAARDGSPGSRSRGQPGDSRGDRRTASAPTGEEDEDEWRHEPREPVDESPLESFGKSIGETLTGSVDDPIPQKTRR